ncbi:MAG TPA: pyridoxal phosphate-dependent aminotransferase [Candidatus Nanoarchaeia archaeon]|nr:pyridoxal phosphate-dependent aminotransferase [Candidatus Nanoarchaeia archaeon]
MMHIAEREIQLPEAVISKLIKVASEDKSVISLGPGEPDFPAPQPIVDFTKQFADKCNHYSAPGGRKELKEAIVKKLKKENGITAHPDNVVVTCGSQEALLLATACTCDVSEQVIIPNPSFLGYLPLFELFNAFPVPLQLHEKDDWNINPDDLKQLIDPKKTKVIMLNTPANPTGNVLSRKLLEEVADIAIEHNLYIFADEAYEKLIYNKPHVSMASLNGMDKYTVTFQTFSKSYAMCGYRLGYAVGPKLLIEAMTKTHIYTTLAAPTISQMVGTKVLGMDQKYVEAMRKEYDKRRKVIVKRLNQMGLPTATPNGAFYTFSNIQDVMDDSFKFAFQLLKEAKVAVVPGKEFGTYGEGYIRCSYATALPRIETALDRMEKFVKKYKK